MQNGKFLSGGIFAPVLIIFKVDIKSGKRIAPMARIMTLFIVLLYTSINFGCVKDRDNPLDPVNLSPVMHVEPTNFSFRAIRGGLLPNPQIMSISNAGGKVLSWKVDSIAASWLSITPYSANANNTDVIIRILSTRLPTDSAKIELVINSPEANADTSVMINISYDVTTLFGFSDTSALGSYYGLVKSFIPYDVDNDNLIDLAVGIHDGNTICVHHNDGGGIFHLYACKECGYGPLKAWDYDSDNNEDLIVGGTIGRINLIRNYPAGTLTLADSYDLPNSYVDPPRDFAVLRHKNGSSYLAVLYDIVDQYQTLVGQRILLLGYREYYPFQELDSVTVDGCDKLLAGYFNNDDYMDLIVFADNRIALIPAVSSHSFGNPEYYDISGNIINANIFDCNQDSYPDVVMNLNNLRIAALSNNGAGGFSYSEQTFTAGLWGSLVACDIDGNGLWDVLAVSENSSIGAFLSAVPCQYEEPLLFGLPDLASGLFVDGDFDNDGDDDIAVITYQWSGEVAVYLNNIKQ